MKKNLMLCFIVLLVGSTIFAQEQEPGFSNTVYTGVGSGSMLDSSTPTQGGSDEVAFDGFVNYFTANIQASGLTIAGDIAWALFEQGSLNASIKEWNFNATMSPFANFDVGVGTNLNWEVGPEPFSGPNYAAYEVPEYAGLNIFANSVGTISNQFAYDAVAVRYEFEDLLIIGAGLNGGLTNTLGAGLGIQADILDLFTIGFAYNGSFGETGNIFYLGSSIYVVDGFDIDVWTNFEPEHNTSVGGRAIFYTNGFRLAPEFTATFWSNENTGTSMFAAIVAEFSITDTMLVGANVSWGLGSDPNTDNSAIDSGARINVSPHFVWNITEAQRLAVGINLIPVWWQDETSEFYWSIPISWKVSF